MRLLSISLLCLVTLLLSCKGDGPKNNFEGLDLMKHGLPIKINAPAGAAVTSDDMGFMKDVTVKAEGNYFVQIMSGMATTTEVGSIKAEQLQEAKGGPFFAEIMEEDEQGFIFKKKITDTRTNYDFRYVKIQGDQEYIFRTGLMGQFSLDEVKAMYASVK